MCLCLLFSANLIEAKPKAPLPFTAFDGGVFSSESLGNGQNYSSTQGTPASGSENPAGLATLTQPSVYTSVFLGDSSSLPKNTVLRNDPVENKVLQYFSLTSDQGAIFFEPLGRIEQKEPLTPDSSPDDFRNVVFSANAFGLAGASKIGKTGSIGLSIAYLSGHLGYGNYSSNVLTDYEVDSANGVRLGFGMRFPTGPFMWGMALKNFPGFLWWNKHSTEILPVTIQVGNTWRIYPGLLFSMSGETRFYNEGSDRENYLKIGQEIPLGKNLVLRGGAFGTDLNSPSKRHLTGGVTFLGSSGAEISYAVDAFKIENENVKKSYLSLRLPFGNGPPAPTKGVLSR